MFQAVLVRTSPPLGTAVPFDIPLALPKAVGLPLISGCGMFLHLQDFLQADTKMRMQTATSIKNCPEGQGIAFVDSGRRNCSVGQGIAFVDSGRRNCPEGQGIAFVDSGRQDAKTAQRDRGSLSSILDAETA